MNTGPIETKVAAGSAVTTVAGVIAWLLVTLVPAFKNGIPANLAPFIPVAAAAAVGTWAAWRAPHTHRPDLTPPAPAVQPTPPAGS
jgi:hypothetical protein